RCPQEAPPALGVGGLVPHGLADFLELSFGLAGGADGDDLPAALLDLPPPRPVQPEVTVPVELLEHGHRGFDAVPGPIVGGVDLDTRAVGPVDDPPIPVVGPEPLLHPRGPDHELGGGTVEGARL